MLVAWTDNAGAAGTLTVHSSTENKVCLKHEALYTESQLMLQCVWATVQHNHVPCHHSVKISCNLGVSGGSVCARPCWARKRMNTDLPNHMSQRCLTSAYLQCVKGHVGSGKE